MKVLVAGWFSFPRMGATAGDLLTKAVVCGWLDEMGRPYDVAVAPPFVDGVDWTTVDPGEYSDVVFVCGPFGNGWPIPEFLERFAGRRLIGLNLSMIEPLDVWNPFDLLIERDSTSSVRPDLVLLAPSDSVPVVGIVLVHDQREYRTDGAHALANAAIERLIESRTVAPVRIDTRLDVNATALRTPAAVETLIARMDVVVTTRLHGLVLALKHGVPAVALDPIAGGAKLCRQARALGWPMCFLADRITDQQVSEAFDYCLTAAARTAARECATRGMAQLADVRDMFFEAVASPTSVK
jgi:hypothetical protein